ncbi:MAG: sulfite oxidase, partial [Bacteroidetes bacterium]|nr:sulfite oxidase [Bacteroidota bacterium]
VKWMGGRRWQQLHRLVYIVALGGVFHYLWLVKADTSRPLRYGAALSVLLVYRMWDFFKSRGVGSRVKVKNGRDISQ